MLINLCQWSPSLQVQFQCLCAKSLVGIRDRLEVCESFTFQEVLLLPDLYRGHKGVPIALDLGRLQFPFLVLL